MNRHSNRRAAALAALSAAALFATTAERSSAQVWNNPTTGSWNNAANWVGGVPVSGPATALTFNASGAQTYTSTNDMPTNPFEVGSLNFSNTGTGVITVTGNPLTGGTATGGAYVRTSSTGTGTSAMNNGGTLYSMRVGQGLMNVTGGTWQLTSTQRQNDIIGGIDNGFWGLNIGDTDGQTSRFVQTGGTINGDGFAYLGVANNSISFATFSGASSVLNFTNATNGRAGVSVGQGTISIENGATWNVRLIEGARSDNSRMNMFVNGPTSSLNSALQILLCRGLGATASLTVSNGALASNTGNSFFGTSEGSNASLIVTGANSRWNNTVTTITSGGSSVPGTGDPLAPGITTVSASAGGQLRSQAWTFGQQNGGTTNVTIDGPTSVLSTVGIGAGTGSWQISGNLGRANLGLAPSVATITLQNGAQGAAGGSVVGGTAFTNSLTNSGGGHTAINVQSGAGLTVANSFFMAANPDCVATLTVNNGSINVNSQLIFTNDVNTHTLANITNGSTVAVVGNSFLSPTDEAGSGSNTTSTTVVNVNASTWTNAAAPSGAGGQLQVGGAGALEGASAILNISNNGIVSTSGGTASLIAVFGSGTLSGAGGVINVGNGTSKGTLIGGVSGISVDGTINFNAGTMTTTGTLGVGGSVLLSSAGRAPNGTASNKKMVEAGRVDMTTSGVIDLNDNDMLLHNDTVPAVQALVAAARNGGLWNMPGITSTAAKNSVPQNKNLGVISGADFLTAGTTFNGKTVVAGDTLVKFTFNGDTDLNGLVDFDDYSRIDNGFNNGRTGWFNGDFDYNGIVDFDDYSLIDQAFNTQGTTVLNATGGDLAGPGARAIISALDGMNVAGMTGRELVYTDAVMVDQGVVNGGSLQAVPEPTTLGAISIGLLGAMHRRRRHA